MRTTGSDERDRVPAAIETSRPVPSDDPCAAKFAKHDDHPDRGGERRRRGHPRAQATPAATGTPNAEGTIALRTISRSGRSVMSLSRIRT